MKRKNTIVRYIGILAITMIASMTACSYVVDMVERSITKRASFSIRATYDHSAQTVTITWTESPGNNFAGYEIYMTEEPDDEYSGYVVVAAGQPISSNSFFELNAGQLLYPTTIQSYTFDVSEIVANSVADFKLGSGRYFFRLGIIKWDQDPSKRTLANGYTADTFANYCNHTDIDEISGLAGVDLYL